MESAVGSWYILAHEQQWSTGSWGRVAQKHYWQVLQIERVPPDLIC